MVSTNRSAMGPDKAWIRFSGMVAGHRNSPDRKSGYRIGEYTSTVAEMYEPCLIPRIMA